MAAELCFLPGFMGSGDDFSPVRQYLSLPASEPWQWPSPDGVDDIAGYAHQCWLRFNAAHPEPFYLYAYSMGGRVALHWLSEPDFVRRCRGLVLAGAHTGLLDHSTRQARQQSDAAWAERFTSQALPLTLQQWYEQPVFRSLSQTQKQQLIASKTSQNPQQLAQILRCASLGTQADLRQSLIASADVSYLVGELDRKFLTLSDTFCPPVLRHCIAQAGHIVHVEQPERVAAILAHTMTTGDIYS